MVSKPWIETITTSDNNEKLLYASAAKHSKAKDLLDPDDDDLHNHYGQRISRFRTFMSKIPGIRWIQAKHLAWSLSNRIDNLSKSNKQHRDIASVYKEEKAFISVAKDFHIYRSLLKRTDLSRIENQLEDLMPIHRKLNQAWRQKLRDYVTDNSKDLSEPVLQQEKIEKITQFVNTKISLTAKLHVHPKLENEQEKEKSKWAYIHKQVSKALFSKLTTTDEQRLADRKLDDKETSKVSMNNNQDEAKFFHATEMESLIAILDSKVIHASTKLARPGVWMSTVPEIEGLGKHTKGDKPLHCGIAFCESIQWQPIHQRSDMPNFLFKSVNYTDKPRIWVGFKKPQTVIEQNSLAPKVAYLFFSSKEKFLEFKKLVSEKAPKLNQLISNLENLGQIKLLEDMDLDLNKETIYPQHWKLTNWHMKSF